MGSASDRSLTCSISTIQLTMWVVQTYYRLLDHREENCHKFPQILLYVQILRQEEMSPW